MKSFLGGLKSALITSEGQPPVPYARDGLAVSRMFGRNRRDRETELAAVETSGTLFSIVHRTSTATAAVRWRLYEPAASGLDEDRVEVTKHAVLDTLDANRYYKCGRLIEVVQQHIDLTGEGYIVVARNPHFKLPLELWPVRPDRMEPVPSATRFLNGWIYTGPTGEQIPLGLDDVIQIQMPNPRDPYRGLGPVQALLSTIDADRYSREWNRAFFENSAQAGGMIKVADKLGDDEWEELQDRWASSHRGVANAHRVGVLEGGAEWVDAKYSMADMQFVELQQQSRDRLLEAYGMGGPMIGVVENVNRANADAADVVFARQLTTTRANRWRDALNTLLGMYPRAKTRPVMFDFDSPVLKDVEAENSTLTARAEAAQLLVSAGYEGDDVAKACSLPEMRWTKPAVMPTPRPAAKTNGQDVPINGYRMKELV